MVKTNVRRIWHMLVYHYLAAEWALDDLRKRRVKIATFDDLNDPFELLVFNMSDKNLREKLTQFKEKEARKYGFLCFSRSWKNPVLWSHYADKHRGFCLGFIVRDDMAKEISYIKRRLVLDIKTVGEKDMHQLLWTKYKGWSYEEEVRLYARLQRPDGSTTFYFHDFDNDVQLKEIIAGPLCSVAKATIQDAIGGSVGSVRIVKARLAFQTFEVVENLQGFG
jgi:hypothetical protein